MRTGFLARGFILLGPLSVSQGYGPLDAGEPPIDPRSDLQQGTGRATKVEATTKRPPTRVMVSTKKKES